MRSSLLPENESDQFGKIDTVTGRGENDHSIAVVPDRVDIQLSPWDASNAAAASL